MIDEKRVRMMTHAARLQKKEGRSLFTAKSFFGGDFVVFQVIKTIIGITIAYGIVAGLWLMSRGEEFSTQYTIDQMLGSLKGILFIYILVLVASIVLTVIVYTRRYWNSKTSLSDYRTTIKKIDKYYRKQDEKAAAQELAAAESDEEPIRIVIS